MPAKRKPPGAYPLPEPRASEDTRFTLGMTLDVVHVLKEHGYPQPQEGDLAELQLVLYRFLYKART